MPSNTTLEFIRNVMLSAVREAGQIMITPEKFDVEQKGDHDFVTECDKKVQSALIGILTDAMPEASFVSEEMDNGDIEKTLAGKCFVIDPIDGTHNFMNSIPLSAICIAYVEKSIPLVGVVYNPYTEEAFNAVYGEGFSCIAMMRNGVVSSRSIKPLENVSMEHGLLLVEDGWHADKLACRKWMLGTRSLGSAALNICYVAAGRGHSYISVPLHVWDYAAAALIAKEAGLAVCDGVGNPLFHLVEPAFLIVGRPNDIPTLVDLKQTCENAYVAYESY